MGHGKRIIINFKHGTQSLDIDKTNGKGTVPMYVKLKKMQIMALCVFTFYYETTDIEFFSLLFLLWFNIYSAYARNPLDLKSYVP